jgi:hypothetical protein
LKEGKYMMLRKLALLGILSLVMGCVSGCGDEAKHQPKIVGGKAALTPEQDKTVDGVKQKVE